MHLSRALDSHARPLTTTESVRAGVVATCNASALCTDVLTLSLCTETSAVFSAWTRLVLKHFVEANKPSLRSWSCFSIDFALRARCVRGVLPN